LPPLSPLETTSRRALGWDLETVAAGYADPDYVPHTVTCWAAAWADDPETVYVEALAVKDFYNDKARRKFITPLVALLCEAGIWTGHNILRYDIPVLNAELMRLWMPTLPSKLVQDTMRFPKSRGFKKGQSDLGTLFKVPAQKHGLNHREWYEAYGEKTLATVKDRAGSDVQMQLLLREEMRAAGVLMVPRVWAG
jgi:hypothetical protein